MNENLRKVEVQNPDFTWSEVDGINVKAGDVFRMFEPDGTPVLDEGTDVFIAQANAYMMSGIAVIQYQYDRI